ncbi:hypothetical protein [Mycobacterium sp. D16R24]|uniref:hypothetical protein n=1 Tax=Mycobacterium sp. D16R24 TaxID=1855656 RepID=UPI001591AA23|nr:hypothetical protein [Mycobacterium sp. D16R24]
MTHPLVQFCVGKGRSSQECRAVAAQLAAAARTGSNEEWPALFGTTDEHLRSLEID